MDQAENTASVVKEACLPSRCLAMGIHVTILITRYRIIQDAGIAQWLRLDGGGMTFYSIPQRTDMLWGPLSHISNGYRA
jgi:hypothetical protein